MIRRPPVATYRGTLSGDGRPGPIEQRIGRRLVRLIDPASDDGVRLLGDGEVDLIGPDGETIGRMPAEQAYRHLLERLEQRLDEAIERGETVAIRQGLARVKRWSQRLRRP